METDGTGARDPKVVRLGERAQKRTRKPIIADPQAERSILGSILLDPDELPNVLATGLQSSDFYEPKHRTIFDAMQAIYARGESVDTITIESHLSNEHQLAEVGRVEFRSLTGNLGWAGMATTYARTVIEKAIERQTMYIGAELTTYEMTPIEAITRLQSLEDRRAGITSEENIFDLTTLMEEALPTLRYVIPHLLPEGLGILGAKQKIGKSWLVFAMCLAVASGGEVLGQRVEQGQALYLALEDGKSRLKTRAIKLLQGAEVPDGLTLAKKWDRLDQGGIMQIERWLQKHEQARLVVIDVFAKVRPPRGKFEDPYQADYAVMGALKALADRYHVAVLVIHHTRKAEASDVFDELLGSAGLGGACDTVMVLSRTRGEADAVLHITGREIEREGQHALCFNRETCQWEMQGDAAEFALSKERRAIIQAIRYLHGIATPSQVTELLHKNPNTIKVTMRNMATDGQLKALGDGTYRVLVGDEDTLNKPINLINRGVDENAASPGDMGADDPRNTVYADNPSINRDQATGFSGLTKTRQFMEFTQKTHTEEERTSFLSSSSDFSLERQALASWAEAHNWPSITNDLGLFLPHSERAWRHFLNTSMPETIKQVLDYVTGGDEGRNA